MPGLPEVKGIGTFVADPEMRFTPSGVAVVNFTLAFNERRFSKGEWIDGDTTFIRCVAWRDMAENIVESMEKGSRCLVVGDLRPNDYEDAEGNKRFGFELLVSEIGPTLKFATAKVTYVKREEEEVPPPKRPAKQTSRTRR